jgi:rod shape-determining protein MreD
MSTVPRHLLIAPGVFGLQWLVLGRLTLFGSYPDAVLLYLAWYALHQGRRRASLMGFVLGAAMDVVYGTWGIHMFVKTLVGFLLGIFASEERDPLRIQPQQAFAGGLVVALVHNGLLVTLLALHTSATNNVLVYALWLGSALYTAVVGTIGALFQG